MRSAPSKGAGLRILTETVTSPTLAGQLRELLGEFPEAKWHQYEPVGRDHARAGARLAFGEDVETRLPLRQGRRHPVARRRLPRRRARPPRATPASSPRGASRRAGRRDEPALRRRADADDHRRDGRPPAAAAVAARSRRFAHDVRQGWASASAPAADATRSRRARRAGSTRSSRDLRKHQGREPRRGRRAQPPAVHAPGARDQPGAGQRRQDGRRTPSRSRPSPSTRSSRSASWSGDMAAGQVDVLVILGGNPAYDAPADLAFAAGARRRSGSASTWASTRTRPRPSATGTSPRRTRWRAWGDVRAFDGTATIQQPLIAPLYGGRSAIELVAALLGRARTARATRSSATPGRATKPEADDFEAFWRTAVHDGVVAGTAAGPGRSRSRPTLAALAAGRRDPPSRVAGDRLPARPDGLGRPVRQQRLAPGAAQAVDQADLGQRRADQPEDRRAARADRTERRGRARRYRGRTLAASRSGSCRARPTTR